MADYPVTKKDFTIKVNDEDVYEADDINDIQGEVRAMIDFIGTGKAEQLSLMNVLQDYRTGLPATIVSGDTINVPASEMMIDTRGVRNTADLTRDLADDITASTDTDYYLFTVDDGDGTFSLEFRTASTAVASKRKIATIHTNDSDATVIDTIVDDDMSSGFKILQVLHTQDGAVATGTTAIPDDDTIPQNTEGDEYMTLAITPANVNNELIIDVVINWAHSVGDASSAVALFQDSIANALAVCALSGANVGGSRDSGFLRHKMPAGTTSAITFKVRAGGVSGTFTFNGEAGARKYGGVFASSITITEKST